MATGSLTPSRHESEERMAPRKKAAPPAVRQAIKERQRADKALTKALRSLTTTPERHAAVRACLDADIRPVDVGSMMQLSRQRIQQLASGV